MEFKKLILSLAITLGLTPLIHSAAASDSKTSAAMDQDVLVIKFEDLDDLKTTSDLMTMLEKAETKQPDAKAATAMIDSLKNPNIQAVKNTSLLAKLISLSNNNPESDTYRTLIQALLKHKNVDLNSKATIGVREEQEDDDCNVTGYTYTFYTATPLLACYTSANFKVAEWLIDHPAFKFGEDASVILQRTQPRIMVNTMIQGMWYRRHLDALTSLHGLLVKKQPPQVKRGTMMHHSSTHSKYRRSSFDDSDDCCIC